MNIIVNGNERTLDDGRTLANLVEDMGLTDRRIAVEINKEIIPRSAYNDCLLQPGDCVEVVAAIGGG